MPIAFAYVALRVPDLRSAEGFYRRAFGMDVAFREVERGDAWWTLPADKDWDDLEAAGVEVGMVALRRDELVLALFPGAAGGGALREICVSLPSDEMDVFVSRPPEGATVVEVSERTVRFEDPFGLQWVLRAPGIPFRSNGAIAGRWLDV